MALRIFKFAQLPLLTFGPLLQIPIAGFKLADQRVVDPLADFQLRGEFRVLLFALLEPCLECDHGEKVYRVALDTSAQDEENTL